MSVDDYQLFCAAVQRVAGIDLAQYKRAQMERRIRAFAEQQKAGSLDAYLRQIQADPAALERFLDRITINVSELYRNPDQYALLAQRVLPQLPAGRSSVRMWSAGCSYGAEAYTLACLALETYGTDVRAQIVGTDIDRRIVDRARMGLFTAEDVRSVPPAVLSRHFSPAPGGGVSARPALQRLCSFRTRDRYEQGWDLILCRNVVIYFTESTRDQVHRNLARALRPGGYLMVGATERVTNPAAIGLEIAHPFIYRRIA
jgi:chemotaxis protein methyltransferase CheR